LRCLHRGSDSAERNVAGEHGMRVPTAKVHGMRTSKLNWRIDRTVLTYRRISNMGRKVAMEEALYRRVSHLAVCRPPIFFSSQTNAQGTANRKARQQGLWSGVGRRGSVYRHHSCASFPLTQPISDTQAQASTRYCWQTREGKCIVQHRIYPDPSTRERLLNN